MADDPAPKADRAAKARAALAKKRAEAGLSEKTKAALSKGTQAAAEKARIKREEKARIAQGTKAPEVRTDTDGPEIESAPYERKSSRGSSTGERRSDSAEAPSAAEEAGSTPAPSDSNDESAPSGGPVGYGGSIPPTAQTHRSSPLSYVKRGLGL